jgi:hypothetical protein
MVLAGLLVGLVSICAGAERTEHFDKDPHWDGRNHRAIEPSAREVRQDFGFSRSAHAGGQEGEVGGQITPAAEPAYYGRRIAKADFDTPLSASGTLACDGRPTHLLLGFFNASTLNEWRTPNTIAMRINGRGDLFFAYVEYCTARWRAGGDSPRSFPTVSNDTGRLELKGFPAKGVHRWSLSYDPNGNEGQGVVTASIDDQTAQCHLTPGHRADGAAFDHFGILPVMKSVDGGGDFWIDDVTINGVFDDFSRDPKWNELNNRRTYTTTMVRPRFDFGFSPTRWAGGVGVGELGGVVYRGDCRYPQRMACYAERLDQLTLGKPLRASGKVVLRRGVSDSGVLIGFFNSSDSMRSNPSQAAGLPDNFFGISTDAPSREGFYFSPAYRVGADARSGELDGRPPRLHPDGQPRDWTFEYSPTAADGRGQITVTLAEQSVKLPLAAGHKESAARFDRFGIITTWIDGNSQTIYFDDLTYTARQE